MQYLIALLTVILTLFYVYRIHQNVKGKRKWIYYEIIYNCFIKFFIGFLGLPSYLNYLTDVFLLVLLIQELLSKRVYVYGKQERVSNQSGLFIAVIYFIFTIFSFIYNKYSFLQYLWGIRNNFRFFVFAWLCCRNMKKKDFETLFDVLSGFFALNIIAVTYEYFFSGIDVRVGDSISGLYSAGLEHGGGNGPLNWIICIVCVHALAKYMSKEKPLWYLVYVIAGAVYMASLSELKIFFIELAIIIIGVVAFSRKSYKIGIIGIGGMIAFYFGINAIYRLFPQFADFYNIDRILANVDLGSGYQGRGTINRMSSISYVFSHFLHSPLQRLFGIGLGNADFSSFSFLQSAFYNTNSWTLYQFFYVPFVLIETGMIGLVLFISYFVNVLFKAVKLKTKSNTSSSNRVIAIMISILAIAMLFYNQL